MSAVKINHIAIHVSSLARSRKFYEDVLGLTAVEEPFKDGLHAWYDIGGGATVHLIEELDLKPPQEISKTNHLCFSMEDMDAFIRNLNEKNCSFENWAGDRGKIHIRPDGIRQIFFRDPDNYWIEVNDDF
ncbi:VOC family protein [Algoriphagus aestuariicola]|uniref:VOC family protein n=1 Tax=Algoriphagus aestuariicola TaxID=1852016 RepID=A0ABS3BXQ7_9BACT|nr:VOC family protein [Algoriphagus aestuariicola]MBN7803599.1 VOC family protein [Algoriphagus aestuariicola]